jgi:hypothetical protein
MWIIGKIQFEVLRLDLFGSLEIHQYRRYIPKNFNTFDHFADCIVSRRGAHLHGNPAAVSGAS